MSVTRSATVIIPIPTVIPKGVERTTVDSPQISPYHFRAYYATKKTEASKLFGKDEEQKRKRKYSLSPESSWHKRRRRARKTSRLKKKILREKREKKKRRNPGLMFKPHFPRYGIIMWTLSMSPNIDCIPLKKALPLLGGALHPLSSGGNAILIVLIHGGCGCSLSASLWAGTGVNILKFKVLNHCICWWLLLLHPGW